MLAAERQAMIVELIKENGSVQVDELAKELNVSSMTIRRDLMKLESGNMIERCHGGAVAKQEVAYETKQTSNKNSKEAIARKCVEFVHPQDSVFLDAGTTTCEIAKLIRDIPDIIIVTNDLEIAQVLKNSDAKVYICGGMVQKETGSLFGRYATEMLKDFRFDVGFFGAASINEEFQVTTPTHEKMWLKRQVPKQCARSYLAVDQSKFGKQSMTWINQLEDYTGVVTDREFLPEEVEGLKKGFAFEKDSVYEEIGNYIWKQQTIERNVQRCYVRCGVNEEGEMYLASVYYGGRPIEHTGIKLSLKDGQFAETASIPYDGGLNYRFKDMGSTTEVVTYKGEHCVDAVKFIYDNEKERIKVEYTGGKPYIIYMADADKKAIVNTFNLATVLSDIKSMNTLKEKSEKKIAYLKNKLEE